MCWVMCSGWWRWGFYLPCNTLPCRSFLPSVCFSAILFSLPLLGCQWYLLSIHPQPPSRRDSTNERTICGVMVGGWMNKKIDSLCPYYPYRSSNNTNNMFFFGEAIQLCSPVAPPHPSFNGWHIDWCCWTTTSHHMWNNLSISLYGGDLIRSRPSRLHT